MKKIIFLILFCAVTFTACQKENNPPSIQQVTASPQEITIGETAQLNCTAIDADGDMIIYSWFANEGSFIGTTTGSSVIWKAPDAEGNYSISVSVTDGKSVTEQLKSINVIVPPSEVTGFVYFSGTTIPVSGVSIKIGALQSTTSSDGKFSIRSNMGNQLVQANKDGFDPYSKNINVTNISSQIIIELTSGTYTSRVYGTVKNEKGLPLSGILVVLLNPDEQESNLKTTTDASGYYQLPSVPQGTRIIQFIQATPYIGRQESLVIANTDYPFSVVLKNREGVLTYDDRTYKTVIINGKEWMAENLAYLPVVHEPTFGYSTEPRYYVYGYTGTDVVTAKQQSNYITYGVLYNWPAAKAACPPGWHLPTNDEWKQLEMVLGMTQEQADGTSHRGSDQGKQMKATSGWYNNGNGTNTSGFSALPGGYCLHGQTFMWVETQGYWWSSTEDDMGNVWYRRLHYGSGFIDRYGDPKDSGFSVRCVKD